MESPELNKIFSDQAREQLLALSDYRYAANEELTVVHAETFENRLAEKLTLYICTAKKDPLQKLYRVSAYGDGYLWTLGLFAAKWLEQRDQAASLNSADQHGGDCPSDNEMMEMLGVPATSISAAVLACKMIESVS